MNTVEQISWREPVEVIKKQRSFGSVAAFQNYIDATLNTDGAESIVMGNLGTSGFAIGDTLDADTGSDKLIIEVVTIVGTGTTGAIATVKVIHPGNTISAVLVTFSVLTGAGVGLVDGTPTANTSNTLDGFLLTVGDRVLFSNANNAAGTNNVYTVTALGGASVLTETTNAETEGDTVWVKNGTCNDEYRTFDGSLWVQTGSATSTDEDGFQNDFTGKDTPGAVEPTYTADLHADLVGDGNVASNPFDSLNDAIEKLNVTLGDNFADNSTINTRAGTGAEFQIVNAETVTEAISHLDDNLGNDVEISANLQSRSVVGASNTGNLSIVNTVYENLSALDTTIGDDSELTPEVRATATHNIDTDNTIYENLDALDLAIGNSVVTGTFIVDTNDVNTNLELLDAALDNAFDCKKNDGAGTGTPIVGSGAQHTHTVDVTTERAAHWNVYAQGNAGTGVNATTDIQAFEVFAATDGGALVDSTIYAKVKKNSSMNISVDVVLDAGKLKLEVTNGGAITDLIDITSCMTVVDAS
jgi:hypothetical protein